MLRERVAKISRSGAALHEALNVEVRCRTQRQKAINSHRELSDVETALKDATKAADKNSKMALGKLENASGDEQSVQVNIMLTLQRAPVVYETGPDSLGIKTMFRSRKNYIHIHI